MRTSACKAIHDGYIFAPLSVSSLSLQPEMAKDKLALAISNHYSNKLIAT